MKRSLVTHASSFARRLLSPQPLPAAAVPPKLRFFSSSSSSNDYNNNENSSETRESPSSEAALAQPPKPQTPLSLADVSNAEFKKLLEKYSGGDVDALPSIMEAIFVRMLNKRHEETDDELMEELQMTPIDGVKDKEFESDFDELYETDEEIDNLYNARQYIEKKMVQDEYFNMDSKKWDEMIQDAVEKGVLKDTGECERILEDMLNWDKLLPAEIKQKVEAKFNELGDMCERGEIEVADAYKQFKEYEDKMVVECAELMKAEAPPLDDDTAVPDKNLHIDDPPGEGPVLRWQTRVVFAPGGDAWHPKNRKVTLSVTVKELGLSKYQFRRLRELVGKRYHPGKDELTITSERYEHREENRKDCLRTLFSLIEEAGKANRMVEEARTSYVKERLKANPQFMERLRAKTSAM